MIKYYRCPVCTRTAWESVSEQFVSNPPYCNWFRADGSKHFHQMLEVIPYDAPR